MLRRAASFALVSALAAATPARAGGLRFVDVEATYLAPQRPGASATVAVSFLPRETEIRINTEPAPRLSLDSAQAILVDLPPRKELPEASGASDESRYVDPRVPVAFPVTLVPKAPRGLHAVKATVTFFYCSKREGWCRKGTSDVELQVKVP